jgi:hypothetical protein
MELLQQRDSKGHFTSEVEPDTELAAKWAKDEERAKLAKQVCERLGFPVDALGVRQLTTGVWVFDRGGLDALLGAAFGIAYGRKTKDKTEVVSTLDMIMGACDIREKFLKVAAAIRRKPAA